MFENGPMSTSVEPEYRSHVTLTLLGAELDPRSASDLLRLRPTHTWTKGEQKRTPLGKVLASGALHQWGGWKKSLPVSQAARPFAFQLRFWARKLRNKAQILAQLSSQGTECSLDCYVASSATASIIIPTDLQSEIAKLGLELRLSFFASQCA